MHADRGLSGLPFWAWASLPGREQHGLSPGLGELTQGLQARRLGAVRGVAAGGAQCWGAVTRGVRLWLRSPRSDGKRRDLAALPLSNLRATRLGVEGWLKVKGGGRRGLLLPHWGGGWGDVPA